jgi:large subunit ribosomal protein L23
VTSVTTDPRHVILEPVVSEKAYNLIQFDKYTFKVRQAIEILFGVHVVAVKIVNVPGKPKRRGQVSGFRPGYKKAIIQLRAGDSIELFEGAR